MPSAPRPCCRVAARSQATGYRKYFATRFPAAETGFDPAQISDLYSRTVTSHIFDSLYYYDYLARPVQIKTACRGGVTRNLIATFRTFTFPIRRGIFFQDDPAFKGTKRELIAQDFVYSLKRFFDPRWKSPIVPGLEEYKILGLNELRQRSLKEKTAFPYDVEVEGLRALDRYTLQIRLAETSAALRRDVRGCRVCSAQWRARSSRCMATRSWHTRSEQVRSGWPTGGALRASFSSAIRIFGKSIFDANGGDGEHAQ